MRASRSVNDKMNMCDFCSRSFATCKCEVIEFGDGIGDDNVIVCSSYIPKSSELERGNVELATDLGIFDDINQVS